MPTITKDEEFSDYLINLIMNNYQSREGRDGKWHVSDLMFPRYAVLSRTEGRILTREDVGFFLTGEAYHEFLQKLLGAKDAEVKGELLNVLGTADYFDGDILLEIKTSRKWTVPDLPQEHYIEQIGYYCAIFEKTSAKIVVIFPTAGRKWDGSASSTVEIVSWQVSFSNQELAEIKDKMKNLTDKLNYAMSDRDVTSLLPPCPDWKFGSIERDKEKQEYFLKIRCPFALEKKCWCGKGLLVELDRKNANRRAPKSSIKDRHR